MSNFKGKQRIIDGQIMTVRLVYQVCGQPYCPCKTQRERRHGPYFYGYWWENGKLRSRYIGKSLPEGAEA